MQFVEPTFTFHHPPSINHERHHALPPERILVFPGRVFSLTLPEFLSHLSANVNYNLNMNIGACTLACGFVLHDSARTRDPEKKRRGDGQMTRNVGSGKIASGSRKSINIHFVYRDLPLLPPPSPPYPSSGVEFSLEEHVLTPDPFSRALPLTCLPLVRIFSNKSHADEKSTMAVAHKETRVFTMSSRCIETCRC